MEEEKLQPVKISAVVRAVKEQGVCMLIDRDDEYYLVTGDFILKLRRKDMWRIQCKLEIQEVVVKEVVVHLMMKMKS